jgi:D-serine deaminase-like pyridoxal phosphate-dependent protein
MSIVQSEALQTPCVLVDAAKLRRNVASMAEVARGHGVALRPHVKTHKMPPVARLQLEAGACGITVAKISEAEVMVRGGARDVFVAFPLVTEAKILKAIELAREARVILAVDSPEGAGVLQRTAQRAGVDLEVRLELDTGLRRTGVPFERAAEVAEELSRFPNLDLTGIFTYRGYVMRDGSPTMDLEAAGLEEGEMMVSAAQEMRGRGAEIRDVSLGSTPTARYAAGVEGVTEVRPGTYVFNDVMQARLGACLFEECALSVLVTVVSRPALDLAIIDGGSKTFATDVQPGRPPLDLEGFGHVVDHPGAVLERVMEEHGMLTVDPADGLGVGDTVRIIPNHVCSTVNLHDSVVLLDDTGGWQTLRVEARGGVR